jgi:hypothetical protein
VTARAWLGGELASAAVFAVPTFLLTVAGARHVTYYGEPWLLYVLSATWFWGPGPLLAVAVFLQSRARFARTGWRMSVVAVVAMSLMSAAVLWSFARQADVHWSLWVMWIAAASAAVLTIGCAVMLAPSRRVPPVVGV